MIQIDTHDIIACLIGALIGLAGTNLALFLLEKYFDEVDEFCLRVKSIFSRK